MSYEQERRDPNEFTYSDAVNIVWTITHIWALPLEILWRRHFGRRYIDGWLFAAVLWPILFCAFVYPQYSPDWSFWFCGFTFLLGIIQRLLAFALDRNGVLRHSFYNGTPLITVMFRIPETAAKRFWEIIPFSLYAGVGYTFSPSMCYFIVGGMICSLIKAQFIRHVQEEQVADLRDAFIEQQAIANRYRGRS